MIGVILVQWPTDAPVSKGGNESKFLGLTAVVISSFSSGFSGVYFEKLIKHNTQSLWTRNTQLAIISSIFALSAVCINDYTAVAEKGFFHVCLFLGDITLTVIHTSFYRATQRRPGVSFYCKPSVDFVYLW